MTRFAKQILIAIVYILIWAGLFWGYHEITKPRPNCNDGIQNQKEEGVDCGLVCGNSCRKISAIEIFSSKLFKISGGDYDVLVQVYNPNSDLGSPKVDYDLVLFDQNGQETDRHSLSFYILPGQIKHVILNSIKGGSNAASAKIIIKNVEWEKLDLFDAQLVSFPIMDKRFNENEFSAVIRNNSDFDFDTVDIGVILYDENNNVVGVNRSNVNTLLSRTERYFKVLWPISVKNVFRIDVESNTNLLNNLNYIKTHGIQEKFQEYYPN